MKKAVSLLVALLTASSVGIVSFAADDNPGTYYAENGATATAETQNGTGLNGTDTDNNVVYMDEPTNNNTTETQDIIGSTRDSGAARTYASSVYNDEDEITSVPIATNELFLVDADGRLAGVNNVLTPDTEYTFKIYRYTGTGFTNTGTTPPTETESEQLKGSDLKNAGVTPVTYGKLRLRTIKGSSMISSAKIEKKGSGDAATYRLVVTTRGTSGTKLTDVQYRIDATGLADPTRILESTHDFRVGYRTISDDMTDIGEGGTITIDNEAPVITKSQFSDIAKSSNYRNIWIEAEDGGWRYYGRVSGMGDTNFAYTYDAIPSVMNALEEHDFKFLTFRSGVTFPTNGEMRIDVSDISSDFETIYTYLYRNGKLTQINTTYDPTNDEIFFRTNYLGSFIMTDRAITNAAILNPDEELENEIENETIPEIENENNNNYNPGMGVDATMNMAIALGMASLAVAGIVIRKKK